MRQEADNAYSREFVSSIGGIRALIDTKRLMLVLLLLTGVAPEIIIVNNEGKQIKRYRTPEFLVRKIQNKHPAHIFELSCGKHISTILEHLHLIILITLSFLFEKLSDPYWNEYISNTIHILLAAACFLSISHPIFAACYG